MNFSTLLSAGVYMALMKSSSHLKEGEKAPAFSLNGADGKIYSLNDFKGKKAVVIFFMCNHCPYVLAKLGVMNSLYAKYFPQGVAFIGINSNNNPDYPDDSYLKMKDFVVKNSIKFPYLFDESQQIAKAYGAVCTPDPFVFDENLNLSYHGRIDDAHYPSQDAPETNDLAGALDSILGGEKAGRVAPKHGLLNKVD